MSGETYTVILVPSANHAVHLEELLKRENILCKMIPVPRQISSDCGVCVRVSERDVGRVRNVAEATGVSIEGLVNL